jgi:hypothetical protein
VTVRRQGATVVRFRLTDGTDVSPVVSERVRIDSRRPTVRLDGIRTGRVYGDSRAVVPVATRSDRISGVAGVSARVDGRTVRLGRPLRLHRLPLSSHVLRVVVTDRAGNRAVATARFAVSTSFPDLRRLVDRFHPRGHSRLAALVRRAERQAAHGAEQRAHRTLSDFIEVAQARVEHPHHRGVLVRDARRLRADLADASRGIGGPPAP